MASISLVRAFSPLLVLLCSISQAEAQGQAPNTAQQLAFAGLRSVAGQGQINGVKVDSTGNLYLLLDQKDGIRLLKTDNASSQILAEAQLGAAGDIGLALALDPMGNVYITGTTTSGSLSGTSGAAIPNRTDSSTNSFVAKFDPSLAPVFVTFTGGSRIAASALAATADAVFVAGITYASNLPVTPNGIQQSPAYGSSQNGFVERFSSDGSTLVYATYLTGATGDTTPTSIAADTSDNAYIAGSTTASGFPTIAALVPAILSTPSGFLARLSPAGDQIIASTFIPGPGLTSLALDLTGQTLLATGSVAFGQFPVDTVAAPLIPTTYQVLLRLPLDLGAVQSSTVLAPGSQSFAAPGANGAVWVDGTLTTPLLPLTALSGIGNAFAARVTTANAIDETARFGGLPTSNPTYASLPAVITSVAVDPTGRPLIAGAIQPSASSSLLAGEAFDLPLFATPTPAFPSTLSDAVPIPANCSASLCSGSAAYLAKLIPTSAAALAFSTNAVPFITLRNLGSAQADNLQLTVSTGTLTTNCPSTLYPAAECNILLSGGSAGTLTATSSDALPQSAPFLAFSATPPASSIVFYPRELDFGIHTSTSPAATRTITVSNLGADPQTFTSALDGFSTAHLSSSSPFSEVSSDCSLAGSQSSKVLAAGSTCHITIAFTASSSSSNDGILQANWLIGPGDVLLSGYSQAASLSVSASEIDFGTQYTSGIHLPRYLYLSNASSSPAPHSALALPFGSPFTLTDACPATLLPASVCRIRIDYLAAQSTSTDSTTLLLDQGLTVLITGKTLPPPGVTGATVNPNLSVTPSAIAFVTPVVVTGISASTQTVAITNTGAAPFSLTLALTGDFTDATSCGATLPGGATCAVVLTFAPAQPGARSGLLAITAGAGTSPAYVTLSGAGTAILPANSGTLDSGSVPIGQPSTQFYKVSQPFNALTASVTGPFTVTLIEDVGYGHGTPPASDFLIAGAGSCHNCFLGIRFQPTVAGLQTGTLTLSSTPGGTPYVLSLTGIGLPLAGLLLTPAAQNFGSAPVHSSSGPALFTLTNLSADGSALPVTPPALTGDFSLSSAPSGGQACGGTLAYTASCFIQVAFTPTALGNRIGTLSFASGSLSAAVTLTGSATPDPGLAISPLNLTFNDVPGPTSTSQPITLTNTSSFPLQIGTPTASSASFQPSSACATLAPGASCTINLSFQPAAATQTAALAIPVTSGTPPQTTTYTVSLSGTYTTATARLQILPGLLQYGPSAVFTQTPPRLFTINNLTSKTLTLNVSIPRQFVLVGAPCTALAPNGSCSFSVAFLPLTNADISGTITATATPSDSSGPLTALAYTEGFGIGTGTLVITGGLIANGIFNFGQVAPGQTLTHTFTLTNANSGDASSITIRRITSAPPFLSTNTCTSALASGQSCTVTATYTPTAAASSSNTDAGSLTIESDAASSPDILNLSGQPGPTAAISSAATLATYTLSQSSLTFLSTTVGNPTSAQSVVLTNTGTIALHVLGLAASADFAAQTTCATIAPGATCTISVASSPQTPGTHVAALEIASDSATSLEFISLISTAAPSPLTLTPASLDFGSEPVGSTTILPVLVTNTSPLPVVFTSISATGDYTLSGTCPTPGNALASNASCTIQVAFTPSATGIRSSTLSVATSASTVPLTISLTGIGTQSRLVITPGTLAFGSIALGNSANLSLVLQNTGSATISSLAFTIAGDYAVTIPCSTPTLSPGSSCTAQITFTPTGLGARPGALTITSSDPSSALAVPLTGTGVQGGGSFLLTVDGAASSTVTVPSGAPASYHLTFTPTGNYSGAIVLTCTPVIPAQYASCSLLPSSITLNGNGTAQLALATINTVSSVGGNVAFQPSPSRPHNQPLGVPFFCLLAPTLLVLWRGRRDLRRRLPLLLALVLAAASFTATGCGGGANPNLRYTPPGTYRFQVTATSTSGVQITQTVTLNLIVTAR